MTGDIKSTPTTYIDGLYRETLRLQNPLLSSSSNYDFACKVAPLIPNPHSGDLLFDSRAGVPLSSERSLVDRSSTTITATTASYHSPIASSLAVTMNIGNIIMHLAKLRKINQNSTSREVLLIS